MLSESNFRREAKIAIKQIQVLTIEKLWIKNLMKINNQEMWIVGKKLRKLRPEKL